MNNGGRVDDNDSYQKRNRVASDEFGRAIAKIAVTQICERLGFDSFNDSAIDALADIAIRYVRDLGNTAKFYANVANRTECNVFDIIQSLEDLGSSTGFPGGSELCTSLVGSGAIKEIMKFVEVSEEVPFAQPVHSFPIVKDRKLTPSFVQMGETPEFKHVPEWLPAFPDPHTYIQTPVWNERTSDPRSDKVELTRQRRKAESSLLSLQKRLLSGSSAVTSTSEVANGSKKTRFLMISENEKPVNPVVLPNERVNDDESNMENHVSIMETFAPVIEAMNVRVSESSENGESDFPDKRPAVRLNFNIGKKKIGDSLDLRLWNRGTGRISSWFGRDDVMDDKKRRAELILRQSIKNPLDLPQL
ncbi:transcription initiation factor TFIID subunit 8-like [Rutidosis leptorrhynchoides]|uniref:transcription initiation factor TFIID subunit 8-like n=1 Tax=Rutidosis leptorrhynchoides TaxID=125765 RepID=UPI003A9935A5